MRQHLRGNSVDSIQCEREVLTKIALLCVGMESPSVRSLPGPRLLAGKFLFHSAQQLPQALHDNPRRLQFNVI